jgi:hypothetical protein
MSIGKKLIDWREEANYFSGKASESGRALAFGGLAIVWLFKKETHLGPTLSNEFLFPVLLFSLSLAIDLIHYLIGAWTWYNFILEEEKKENATEDKLITAPETKRDWVSAFFYVKFIILIVAYLWLFLVIIRHFNSQVL